MTVLSENSEVSLLCDFNFSGLEEEVSQFTVTAGDTHTCTLLLSLSCCLQVELVLDIGAQSSPAIDSVYYDILYCYHMSRDNFWKGMRVCMNNCNSSV